MDLVLATLNAKYIHAAFGLRYLMANLPASVRPRAVICEYDINQRPIEIVESILAQNPKIVGLGVYIWNAENSLKVVADLKRLRPELIVIVGGPEVSFETDQQEIARLADYVIRGEADLAFGDVVEKLLTGRRPLMRVIDAVLPEFGGGSDGVTKKRSDEVAAASSTSSLRHSVTSSLSLPYDHYTDTDIAQRVLYVEASRGCPFKCEFCLSSLDVPVRNAPLDDFLAHMQRLLDRGARQFKFVDRTFNLNLKLSLPIVQFFLDRYTPGLFIHFEMIPDRLPEALRQVIARFPPGALQFEVGIQTFNPDVEQRISRRQDHARLTDNLTWLRDHTGVHVHADLIVGLPGEDLQSFGRGFDQLLELRPQEIQVGILKRLRGTPICRHDEEWGMVYSPHPPYEVLQTKHVPFHDMQRMRRFSRYWDLVANSGKFKQTIELLLDAPDSHARPIAEASPLPQGEGEKFARFLAFSDWLHARAGGRTHGIALHDLTEFLRTYLVENSVDAARVDAAIKQDRDPRGARGDLPKRQARHAPQTVGSVR
jgi:radical SAM superfamily enzyme YgiQ (UPF0313 family)